MDTGGHSLDEVVGWEAEEIGRRRREFRVGPGIPLAGAAENLAGENRTGLSLSGGGIRSACFNLGLLEALDRGPADPREPTGPNRLECFDYVSSVSGGSYAAGHFATTMLAPTPDRGEGERLGNVQLTSKTVPGWTWGLGVWFLGVVFQLLKTGSLLVAALAMMAFLMRMLDAPDARAFCTTMGMPSDLARGFVPFWLTLWAFLVGYCLNSSLRRGGSWAKAWFAYFAAVSVAYALAAWSTNPGDAAASGLSFGVQYAFVAALFAPPALACAGVAAWRCVVARQPGTARWAERGWGCVHAKARRLERWTRRILPRSITSHLAAVGADDRDIVSGPSMKLSLLAPILVALFCFAALVTTGDVGFGEPSDEAGAMAAMQARSRWYGELGDKVYFVACAALSLISAGLLFPPGLFKNALFKSARRVEEYDASAKGRRDAPRRGWEPVFRVVVFLGSYGFVLLVVFVVFGTVARENLSGYYEWRTDLPSATLHPTDLREADPIWDRIERDAREGNGPWASLAKRLSRARDDVGFPLVVERARAAQIRLLDSRSWVDRALWPIARAWARAPWRKDGHVLSPSASTHYDKLALQAWDERRLMRRISETVLADPRLHEIIPETAMKPEPADLPPDWDAKRHEGLGERYRREARRLAAQRDSDDGSPLIDDGTMDGGQLPGGASLDAAIRNNNRRALHLYLPGLMRDRRDKVVFASIVWDEDQWARLRIALAAAVLWILCCVVDVNTYALQKFYRGHVIDGWVRIEPGKRPHRWLHQALSGYRGRAYGTEGTTRSLRRAPLPLINATLEGNRSLGHEPEMPVHVFTFSPLATGSGGEGYWRAESRNGVTTEEFARRNRLDIGNIVAISGAFLSPGTIANPALSAVLHLLNVQTGYWVCKPDDRLRRSIAARMRFHLRQSIGMDGDGDARLLLTDGAHVDNLGLYTLLRRRCRLIVASDCSQEDAGAREDRRFDALIQVLQQAAVDGVLVGPFLSSEEYQRLLRTGETPAAGLPGDGSAQPAGLNLVRPVRPAPAIVPVERQGFLARLFGVFRSPSPPPVPVPAPPAPAMGVPAPGARPASPAPPAPPANSVFSREHYVFARLEYPDGTTGLLVYLRPTLTGDEGLALLHDVGQTPFPDDDPVDQFYTPARMNSYRILGRHVADKLMEDPVMLAVLAAILRGGDVAPPLPKRAARRRSRPTPAAPAMAATPGNGNGNGNGNGHVKGVDLPAPALAGAITP